MTGWERPQVTMGPTDRRHTPTEQPVEPAAAARGRFVLGVGVQGRLTLAFGVLLTAALSSACWLFASRSGAQLDDMLGEQARLVAYTLSIAAEPPLYAGQHRQLATIGHDLLNTRNVLYVAFLDASGKPVELAKRYVDFGWSNVAKVDPAATSLYVQRPPPSPVFGEHVDVYAPVYYNPPRGSTGRAAVARRLGTVVVGVSLDRERAELQWVTWVVAGIGGATVLLSLPVAFALVYGIFKPIRRLVDATRKMAAGRSDFDLDTDRADQIGELSRSFTDMAGRVRRQREALHATNVQLADANGRLNAANAALGTLNDALNVANARLSDANRDLEQKVAERTAQLEAANRRLSGEISEKEDFLRAVSHDLNAPLRNIAGMATMLLAKHRDQFDADVVHRLERIQKNVQVETDLIGELLELSRIKTRRQVMERVDVAALVADIGGVFEQDLQSRGIGLVVDGPLPALLAERARVRQVFQNLIDNAIKYMGERPDHPREIHVGCAAGGDASEASFYVRDTGVGIEPEDVDKVFHVFRRGRNAAASNVPGKGVGLASVKAIVEMYNGSIWVESTPGQGSTFRFTVNGEFVAPAVGITGERRAA
jgi:signal transduction histidine kinase